MRFYADLHLAPAFARSLLGPENLEQLALAGARRGLSLLAAPAGTLAERRSGLRDALVPTESGFYALTDERAEALARALPQHRPPPRFVAALVGRSPSTHRPNAVVDHVIVGPNFAVLDRLLEGARPERTAEEWVLRAQDICPEIALYPALAVDSPGGLFRHHDSLEEAYGRGAPLVRALDPGAAADPEWLWRVPAANDLVLLPGSRARTLRGIGSQAFEAVPLSDYHALLSLVRTGNGLLRTLDRPAECARVAEKTLARARELQADTTRAPAKRTPSQWSPALSELIADAFGTQQGTARVRRATAALHAAGSEFHILFERSLDDLAVLAGAQVAEGIRRLRIGRIHCVAGDGQRPGRLRVFHDDENGTSRVLALPFAAGAPSKDSKSLPTPTPVRPRTCPHRRPLDREQRLAVTNHDHPVLVSATAGTGKSFALVHAAAHAVQCVGHRAEQVLILASNEGAAARLRAGLWPLLTSQAASVRVTTFPALAEEILSYANEVQSAPVARAADLLSEDVDIRARERARVSALFVDDYHLVGKDEHAIVRLLAPTHGPWAAADPDQHGQETSALAAFPVDFPHTFPVALYQSHRTGQDIARAALLALAPSDKPRRHRLLAGSGQGGALAIAELETGAREAEHVAQTIEHMLRDGAGDQPPPSLGDFAVLFSDPQQSLLLRQALTRYGLPYQFRTHQALAESKTVHDILETALDLPASVSGSQRLEVAAAMVSGRDSTLEVRDALTLLGPLAGASGDDLEHLARKLETTRGTDTFDPFADRIALLTIEAACGHEFRTVFVVGCDDGILPTADTLQVSRHRLYLAMSRARRSLMLCSARQRLWNGRLRTFAPSPFVRDIESLVVSTEASRTPPRQLSLGL